MPARNAAPRNNQGYARQQDGQQYPPMGQVESGISMVSGPIVPGVFPSLLDRLLPVKPSWRTFTTFITFVDLFMFIATLIVGAVKFDGAIVKGNSMGGPSGQTLKFMGAQWEPEIRDGAIWLLFSPIILHAGIMHIFSNTLMQLRFGYVLEARWGTWWLAFIYVLCGLGASLLSCVAAPDTISVGASGALTGLLGADLAYLAYNWAEIPHRSSELCFLIMLIILNTILGAGNKEINNWAHLGGFLTGLLAAVCFVPRLVIRSNEKVLRGLSGAVTFGFLLLLCLLLWVANPKDL